MNRDHFSHPLQGGGRDAYDYGQTTLEPLREPMTSNDRRVLIALAIMYAMGLGAAVYVLWQIFDGAGK